MVAAQAPGVRERTRLSVEQTERAAWTVIDDIRAGGPRSVALMLAVAWNTKLPMLVFRIPGAGWVLDRVYETIAANRHRLPGVTPWCDAHTGGCVSAASDA